MIYRKKIIKRQGEVGRELQQIHGESMIQDQRAKTAVTWAMVGGIMSDFIDARLVDKNKGDKYVVISLWLVTSLVVPYAMAPTNFAFKSTNY